MIRVFGPNDRDFTSNGDCVIQPYKAKVIEQDNGDFYLDLECSSEYSDYIKAENLLVVDLPKKTPQAFRILNYEKTGDIISLRAWHVFYDAKNCFINTCYIFDAYCPYALLRLTHTVYPNIFTLWTNVYNTKASYHCVRKSLYEALQVVLDRWGGHLVRDNFRVNIYDSIGSDNGISIRYRKDIKKLTSGEDWDDVVTELYPVGKDGVMLNDLQPADSPKLVSKHEYFMPFVKTVSFQQDIDEAKINDKDIYNHMLYDDLRGQATTYLAKHSVPYVNYTLNAEVNNELSIGDTVRVIDERIGANLLTNVISYEYDCIRECYARIEFGNKKKSLSGFGYQLKRR